MKDKLKKFFSKDNLFIIICTLLIGLFVAMTVLFFDKDIKRNSNNNKSSISLVDDFNYYKNDFTTTSRSYITLKDYNNSRSGGWISNYQFMSDYFDIEDENFDIRFNVFFMKINLNDYRYGNNSNFAFDFYFHLQFDSGNGELDVVNDFFSNNGIPFFNYYLSNTSYTYNNYNDLVYQLVNFSYSDVDLWDGADAYIHYSFINDFDITSYNYLYIPFFSGIWYDPLDDYHYFNFEYNNSHFASLYGVGINTYNSYELAHNELVDYGYNNGYDEAFQQQQSIIDDYESQVDSLEEDISDLNDVIGDLRTDIFNLNNDINNLEQQNEELKRLSSNNNVLLNYQLCEYENTNNEYHVDTLNTFYSHTNNITYLSLFDSSYSGTFSPNDIELLTDYINIDNALLFIQLSNDIRTINIDFLNGSDVVYNIQYDFSRGDILNNPILLNDSFKFNSIRFTSSDNFIVNNNSYLNVGISTSESTKNFYLGYNEGKSESQDTIDSLNSQVDSLNSQVDSLEYQLSIANENAQNQLNGLTYTMISAVMSTPFNILHDMLNFDFFGINIFSLFTSLITLLLLIWVIKFLIGRK